MGKKGWTETALLPAGITDVSLRKRLRGRCVRVASAFDDHFVPIDVSHVRKVAVTLWASGDAPASFLPGNLGKNDQVLTVERPYRELEAASAERLLAVHASALREVAKNYGWSSRNIDVAERDASEAGIVAKRCLPDSMSPDGSDLAHAAGLIDDDGIQVTLEIIRDGVVRDSVTRSYLGELGRLDAALGRIEWTAEAATLVPTKGADRFLKPIRLDR